MGRGSDPPGGLPQAGQSRSKRRWSRSRRKWRLRSSASLLPSRSPRKRAPRRLMRIGVLCRHECGGLGRAVWMRIGARHNQSRSRKQAARRCDRAIGTRSRTSGRSTETGSAHARLLHSCSRRCWPPYRSRGSSTGTVSSPWAGQLLLHRSSTDPAGLSVRAACQGSWGLPGGGMLGWGRPAPARAPVQERHDRPSPRPD